MRSNLRPIARANQAMTAENIGSAGVPVDHHLRAGELAFGPSNFNTPHRMRVFGNIGDGLVREVVSDMPTPIWVRFPLSTAAMPAPGFLANGVNTVANVNALGGFCIGPLVYGRTGNVVNIRGNIIAAINASPFYHQVVARVPAEFAPAMAVETVVTMMFPDPPTSMHSLTTSRMFGINHQGLLYMWHPMLDTGNPATPTVAPLIACHHIHVSYLVGGNMNV